MRKFVQKISFFIIFSTVLSFNLSAQDFHFSQNNSNPLFINPAFAGSVGCSRVALNYRNQWPSLSGNYVTYTASYDQYVKKLSGGLGLSVVSDRQGNGMMIKNSINGMYAFNLSIGENLHIRPAINIGLYQNRIDESLINTVGLISSNPKYFFNAGAGLLIAYKNFVSGFAIDHLNEPDESFTNSSSKLPSKITAHASYQYNLNDDAFLTPSLNFQKQQDFYKFLPSLMFKYKFVKLGFAGRFGKDAPDCLIGMAGFVSKKISVGYSYDYTVSRLSNSSGGSHEISLVYKFNCKNDKENYKIVPDYDF